MSVGQLGLETVAEAVAGWPEWLLRWTLNTALAAAGSVLVVAAPGWWRLPAAVLMLDVIPAATTTARDIKRVGALLRLGRPAKPAEAEARTS